jgi:hypothetical protein
MLRRAWTLYPCTRRIRVPCTQQLNPRNLVTVNPCIRVLILVSLSPYTRTIIILPKSNQLPRIFLN